MKKTKTPRTTLAPGLAKVLKRLHYPLEVILPCVRWYVAYSVLLQQGCRDEKCRYGKYCL